MEERNTHAGSVGFCGLLSLVLITLKLLGKIDWSWWLVLSPIWIPVIIWVTVVLIVTYLVRRI